MPSVTEEELREIKIKEQDEADKRKAAVYDLSIKYKNVFNSEDGTAVLEDLKKFCGYERISFTIGGKSEPYTTMFYEGCRNVIIYILSQVNKELKF